MADIRNKIAYLQGLAEGLDIDPSTANGKLLGAVLAVLEAAADELDEANERIEALEDVVDEISDDLADIEEVIFEDDDDDEDDEDDDDDGEDADYIELHCPACDARVIYDEGSFKTDGDHLCPSCGAPLFTDIEEGDAEPNG